ncbi:MAG TPA: hypothetical protein DEA08_08740 [Planctomycetes bacterium]|nr:hypothetical protein [Planctomycetota bacterium]|tara:strand:+ start:465 stop:1760 length:1296 start_codon:yes stop_codon:yes gene_type:complete
MNKLRWIEIHEFRNVVPETSLRFSEGFNVLLGRNGTGKTNLLHLISMALRLDFEAVADEAFEVEFEIAGPENSKLVARVRNRRVESEAQQELFSPQNSPPNSPPASYDFCFELRVGLSDGRELEIRSSTQEGVKVLVAGDEPKGLPGFRMVLNPTALMSFFFELLRQKVDLGGTVPLVIMGLFHAPYRFDEGLNAFHAMHGVGDSVLSSPHRAWLEINRPKAKATSSEVTPGLGVRSSYLPSNLYMTIVSAPPRPAGKALLRKAATSLGFKSVEWQKRLQQRESLSHGGVRETYAEFEFGCALHDGGFVLDDQLSFGEKRLLAFLYYLETAKGCAIVDELANGLHYDWIQSALDWLEDRQAFLTSQNSLLLDFLPITSAEGATEMFIRCEHVEDRKWCWKNFTDNEGSEFYRDLSVGVEHVSQILRTRGLW